MFFDGFGLIGGIFGLIIYLLSIYCWYRIMRKAGYGLLGLLSIVAPLQIILLLILAFGEWRA